MENVFYDYYEIDIADIWEYERELFLADPSKREHAQYLMDLTQQYIIKYSEPDFGVSMFDIGLEGEKSYFSRNIIEYLDSSGDLERLYRLNYFFYNTNCFDYNHVIILTLKDSDFPFFFTLKLRQYNKNLFELNNFLIFQLGKSFNNNEVKYTEFIRLQLLQYGDFLTEGLKRVLEDFISSTHLESKPSEKEETFGKERSPMKEETESFAQQPTVWQYALFYVYVISSREHERIDQIAELRMDAFATLASRHNISANAFEQYFRFYDKVNNRNGKISDKRRALKTIRDDIQYVKDNMLAKYPKALALAQTDLDQIITKT